MNARKPYNRDAGYVGSLRCALGGHIVIYDRGNPAKPNYSRSTADWIDADERLIVMHQPSTLHVSVSSLDHARHVMRGVARAKTHEEATTHADILPA